MAWLHSPSFPAQSSLLTASHRQCQLPESALGPLEGEPHMGAQPSSTPTTWGPLALPAGGRHGAN